MGIRQVVASNLTRLRIARNMTQEQLAEATGITYETINRLERAVHWPKDTTLDCICDVLDASYEELLQPTKRTSGSRRRSTAAK